MPRSKSNSGKDISEYKTASPLKFTNILQKCQEVAFVVF